jgi:hypothetical protein
LKSFLRHLKFVLKRKIIPEKFKPAAFSRLMTQMFSSSVSKDAKSMPDSLHLILAFAQGNFGVQKNALDTH